MSMLQGAVAVARRGPVAVGRLHAGSRTVLRHQPVNAFHTSLSRSSARSLPLARLKKELGSAWPDKALSTKLLTESLKLMQSRHFIKGQNDRGAPYRDALRDLASLTLDKENVTMSEIEAVLSPENGVTWRTIGELLKDGSVALLRAMSDETRAACLFARVHGIGPVKASALASMGCRALEDLEKQVLSKAQRIGLDHLDDMEKKIPRMEIDEFDTLLKSCLTRADPQFSHAIMGSYRRGNTCSSDIDVVVWHPSFFDRDNDDQAKGLMDKLKAVLYGDGILQLDKVMAAGDRKIMGLTRLPESVTLPASSAPVKAKVSMTQAPSGAHPWRQVDIRLCPVPSLPYMLLGNTGDDTLMKILRARAIHRGWVLNEYGMGVREGDKTSTWVKKGTELLVKTEREIFEKLEVPYLAPEQRGYATYEKILGRQYLA